jgi:hypothetical protein
VSRHVVQLLLPLFDNDGRAFPKGAYREVRDELVGRFGGLTAYTRAPASGLWHEDEGQTVRDELIVYEVMCDALDADWWRGYRATLEARFAQDSLVMRAHEIQLL